MNNAKWSIPIDRLWSDILSHPKQFSSAQQIIVESDYDDDDEKWLISAYKNGTDDGIEITLETYNGIISTANCNSEASVRDTVNAFLEAASDL